MIQASSLDKRVLEKLRGKKPLKEFVRAEIRKFKPIECPCCKSQSLHGHGWRLRWMVTDSGERLIWFWRVRCVSCKILIQVIPELYLPGIYYSAEVVSEVIVGRLNGSLASEYSPHRKTQKRWIARILHWYSVALSAGIVVDALSEIIQSVSTCMKSIIHCAKHHIGLFRPSHAKLYKMARSGSFSYPVVSTHQTCPWTSQVAL